MNEDENYKMFSNLSFEKFKELAKNKNISKFNRVGFPDKYREGQEELILKDLISKVNILSRKYQKVLEIGPGCSNLAHIIINFVLQNKSELTLIDSKEMLDNLPDNNGIKKEFGMFPNQFHSFIRERKEYFNAIITYSVIQYIFKETDFWEFLVSSITMLKKGGILFLGDIPNISMRKRFLNSDEGIKFQNSFYKNKSISQKEEAYNENKEINDIFIMDILIRARNMGCHAWVVPQLHDLTFSNRREDIIIKKP
tara:strand:- start:13 stop:774 length:762 start_codon:yes stop_codon:yes gene_type:complete